MIEKIINWPPYITVAAIIEDAGKFLLVEEQIENKIVYNQPAGHLEPNETIIAATIRETLEETAWHYQPNALVGLYFYTNECEDKTYLRFCFCGIGVKHDATRALDQDIIRALWLSYDEIQQRSKQLRSPMVLQCIEDYMQGKRFPLDLLKDFRYER